MVALTQTYQETIPPLAIGKWLSTELELTLMVGHFRTVTAKEISLEVISALMIVRTLLATEKRI